MAIVASDPLIVDSVPETAPGQPVHSLSAPVLTALPGDGFAIAWNEYSLAEGGESGESQTHLNIFDSDGGITAAPTIDFPAGFESKIAASTDGTIALMTSFGAGPVKAQVFDLAGEPVAPEQTLFDPGPDAGHVHPASLAALPDGGYAATWWQLDESLAAPAPISHLGFILPNGQAGPAAIEFADDAKSMVQAAVVAGGEVKVIAATGVDNTKQPALFRFSEDGALIAAPIDPRGGVPSLIEPFDFDRLANGDLAVTWLRYEGGPVFSDRFAIQRLDGAGNQVAPVNDVDATAVRQTGPQIAALQDGGYVAAWIDSTGTGGTGEQGTVAFQVFDRDDNAMSDVQRVADDSGTHRWLDIATLDDGRFVITYEHASGDEGPVATISAQVFDHAASHTPVPGGTIAFAETWQDQLEIGRDDGIDTLVTSDSLPLLPFIPNLTMAGAADLNANGNDMANFMIGNDGDNIVVGFLGNDVMHGHGGDDFLAMGRGNDVADAGVGDDIVWGGQGNDSVAAGAGADSLNGDRHDDVIDGGDGDDWINGGSHEDLLTGADGDDSIAGGVGADTLEGWDGADTLRGDRDDDQLEGGDGADRFAFASFFGNDTVLDFRWADGDAGSDRIVVEVDEDGTINGVLIDDEDDLLALAEDTDDGVLIAIGTGHSILLAGWEKADLTADALALLTV